MQGKIIFQPDTIQLIKEAATVAQKKIARLLAEKQTVVMGISGGRSIVSIFQLLLQSPLSWQRVMIFMIDERLVPIDDQASNSGLIQRLITEATANGDKVIGPQFYPFLHQNQPLSMAVQRYQQQFDSSGGVYDILLMGVGEDGHVASLFPHHEAIQSDRSDFIVIENAPKPPVRRISASPMMLKNASIALAFCFGQEKRNAYAHYSNRDMTVADCPAKLIDYCEEHYFFTDITL